MASTGGREEEGGGAGLVPLLHCPLLKPLLAAAGKQLGMGRGCAKGQSKQAAVATGASNAQKEPSPGASNAHKHRLQCARHSWCTSAGRTLGAHREGSVGEGAPHKEASHRHQHHEGIGAEDQQVWHGGGGKGGVIVGWEKVGGAR